MIIQLIVAVIFCKIVFPVIKILSIYTMGRKLFSHRSKLQNAGEWAIITGGSAGIGKAYACELAKIGLNVLLLGHQPDELADTAQFIAENYTVQAKTLVVDFSRDDIYSQIELTVHKLSSVACLVNNVGIFYPEKLDSWPESSQVSFEFIRRIVWCNMVSTTSMTRIVLRKMLTQRPLGAAIINLSSVSARMPFPYFSLYGSCKAFVLFFSEALRNELKDTSIIIQAVCPSLVATAMTRAQPTRLVPDAETYVKSAFEMLGVESVTSGYIHHALSFELIKLTPPKFIKARALKAFKKRIIPTENC